MHYSQLLLSITVSCLICYSIVPLRGQSSLEIMPLQLATNHSGESDLFVDSTGTFYLSWIEYVDDATDVLMFAMLRPEQESWTEPKEIARGDNWFVNWADFPAIIGSDGGQHIASHWLQKSSEGTYDYDIMFSQSLDGGITWSAPISPHQDRIKAEHGFVSMAYTTQGDIFLTWLDGRYTKQESNNAMTLRSAELSRTGVISNEAELDSRVCDCCQTSTVYTSEGPIVVYRDRSENEIRDIGIVKSVDGKWLPSTKLHEDKWKIAGCPVNGPAIAHYENTVAIAWFTMDSLGDSRVNAVISTDGGSSFSSPYRMDEALPIGRVDIVVSAPGKAIISWMEHGEEQASIVIRKLSLDGPHGLPLVVGTNAISRGSGFPRMAYHHDQLILSYSKVINENKQVKTFRIKF